MKKYCLIGLFVLAMAAFAAAPAMAAMITFESPTYTAGSTFVGVDSWHDYWGDNSANLKVTPISGGETRVLDDLQSAAVFSPSKTGFADRPWDSGTTFDDRTVIEGDLLVSGTAGSAEIMGSQYLPNLNNFVGVQAKVGSNFFLSPNGEGGGSGLDTGVSVVTDHKYHLEMALNFTAGTYEGFYTDITASGSRTSLGTALMWNSRTDAAPTPEEAAAGGWILAVRGGATGLFDNLDVTVPEPSALILLSMGAISLLAYAWRKRK